MATSRRGIVRRPARHHAGHGPLAELEAHRQPSTIIAWHTRPRPHGSHRRVRGHSEGSEFARHCAMNRGVPNSRSLVVAVVLALGAALTGRCSGPGRSVRRRRARSEAASVARALALVPILLLGAVSAPAADDSALLPAFGEETLGLWSGAGACTSAFEESMSTECLVDQAFNAVLMGEATRFATERGRALFGERFRIANRLSWSPGGAGLRGDIDAVFPVSFVAAEAHDLPRHRRRPQHPRNRLRPAHLHHHRARGGRWRLRSGQPGRVQCPLRRQTSHPRECSAGIHRLCLRRTSRR